MKSLRLAALATALVAGPLVAQNQPASYLATDRPVNTNEIRIGVSLPETGRTNLIGNDYLKGARAFFDKLNEREKGIHGRVIKLIAYDDRFEVLPAVLNTRRLINDDKVFVLLNYVGGVGTRSVGLMLGEAQIPLLGAFTGAQSLRQPINRYLFHLRPGFNEETALIVEHLITDRQVTKIAVFHQLDADGESILRGVERALRPRGTKVAATASYVRNTVDVSAATDALLAAKPDAVILGGTYQASSALVTALKARNFSPIFVGTSFVGAESFIEAAGAAGEQVFFTQVVPPPTDASIPIVASFRGDMAGQPNPRYTQVALEGYLNAAALASALRDTGPNLTTPAFLKVLENLNADLGGITVTFTPSTRQGLKDFYLSVVRNGALAKVEKFTP